MNKLVRCFLNADFRCQHKGLNILAKKEGCDSRKLKHGEHIMFVNTQRNKIKMISSNNIMTYMSLDRGKVDLECIQAIAQNFSRDLTMSYKKALTVKIKKRLRISEQ